MMEVGLRYSKLLVAFSELALKARATRRKMTKQLIDNITYALSRAGLRCRCFVHDARIFVETEDPERASKLVAKVFGVAYSMPVVEATASFEAIRESCLELAQARLRPGMSFAIRARKVGKELAMATKEIERELGAQVLEAIEGIEVDLENPDVTIYVEVRGREAYVGDRVDKGVGGLPLGCEGAVVSLLSGGVDSALAAWLMMKRGARILPLYLDLGEYADPRCSTRAVDVAKRLHEYATQPDFALTIVPFDGIQDAIAEAGARSYTCILCKRMMYRIACKMGERFGAKAIVTGEALGQVASQTLSNLVALDEASTLPVFRPLIGMNKEEIVSMAEGIGLREIAAIKIARCKAAPRKPTTRARLKVVHEVEQKLSVEELVEKAISSAEKIALRS